MVKMVSAESLAEKALKLVKRALIDCGPSLGVCKHMQTQ